jgi:hypothetical protein
MVWFILAVIFIPLLAFLFFKATKGTRFVGSCPCAGNAEHLRWREESDTPPGGKKPPTL